MTSGSNPNGVWTQVIAVIPRPEIEELAKIIGKRLIDTNEVRRTTYHTIPSL